MNDVRLYAITEHGRLRLPHSTVDDAIAWARAKNRKPYGSKVSRIIREVRTEYEIELCRASADLLRQELTQ